MPIEIRELVIKTTINDEDQQPGGTTASESALPADELINECVSRVMDLIKQQTER